MKKIIEWNNRYLNTVYAKILFVVVLICLMLLFPTAHRIINGEDIYEGFYEKQIITMVFTFLATYITSQIDYRILARYSLLVYCMGILQIFIVATYGTGTAEGIRWVEWKGLCFDSTVLSMLAIVMVLPYIASIAHRRGYSKKTASIWMVMAGLTLAVAVLKVCGDLGSCMVVALITVMVTFSYITSKVDRVYWMFIGFLVVATLVNMVACHIFGLASVVTYSRIMMLVGILVTYLLLYLKLFMDEVNGTYGKHLILGLIVRVGGTYFLALLSGLNRISGHLRGNIFSDIYILISMVELGLIFGVIKTTKKLKEKARLEEKGGK